MRDKATNKMIDLTKKEIFAQLKKLGINSASEISSYYKEYRKSSEKTSQEYYEYSREGLDIYEK